MNLHRHKGVNRIDTKSDLGRSSCHGPAIVVLLYLFERLAPSRSNDPDQKEGKKEKEGEASPAPDLEHR